MFARLISATLCASITLLAGAIVAEPDDSAARSSRPSEVARLGSYVGIWKTTQKFRATPDAPLSESSSTEKVRWSDTQLFLISEQHGQTADGWEDRIVIWSWNPADRKIHALEVGVGGSTIDQEVWFEGRLQKMLGYRQFQGRLLRVECTVEAVSETERRFNLECADGEKTWVCSGGISRKSE